MTVGTLELSGRFRETASTPASAARVRETPTIAYSIDLDNEWAETLLIMSDSAFMRQIRTGLAQLERKESLTFEQVFGEPF